MEIPVWRDSRADIEGNAVGIFEIFSHDARFAREHSVNIRSRDPVFVIKLKRE